MFLAVCPCLFLLVRLSSAAQWLKWSSWPPCPATCGSEKFRCQRYRKCDAAGKCKGSSSEHKQCCKSNPPCGSGSSDSTEGWTKWKGWTKCPVTCGHANHMCYRTRSCNSGTCSGKSIVYKPCCQFNGVDCSEKAIRAGKEAAAKAAVEAKAKKEAEKKAAEEAKRKAEEKKQADREAAEEAKRKAEAKKKAKKEAAAEAKKKASAKKKAEKKAAADAAKEDEAKNEAEKEAAAEAAKEAKKEAIGKKKAEKKAAAEAAKEAKAEKEAEKEAAEEAKKEAEKEAAEEAKEEKEAIKEAKKHAIAAAAVAAAIEAKEKEAAKKRSTKKPKRKKTEKLTRKVKTKPPSGANNMVGKHPETVKPTQADEPKSNILLPVGGHPPVTVGPEDETNKKGGPSRVTAITTKQWEVNNEPVVIEVTDSQRPIAGPGKNEESRTTERHILADLFGKIFGNIRETTRPTKVLKLNAVKFNKTTRAVGVRTRNVPRKRKPAATRKAPIGRKKSPKNTARPVKQKSNTTKVPIKISDSGTVAPLSSNTEEKSNAAKVAKMPGSGTLAPLLSGLYRPTGHGNSTNGPNSINGAKSAAFTIYPTSAGYISVRVASTRRGQTPTAKVKSGKNHSSEVAQHKQANSALRHPVVTKLNGHSPGAEKNATETKEDEKAKTKPKGKVKIKIKFHKSQSGNVKSGYTERRLRFVADKNGDGYLDLMGNKKFIEVYAV